MPLLLRFFVIFSSSAGITFGGCDEASAEMRGGDVGGVELFLLVRVFGGVVKVVGVGAEGAPAVGELDPSAASAASSSEGSVAITVLVVLLVVVVGQGEGRGPGLPRALPLQEQQGPFVLVQAGLGVAKPAVDEGVAALLLAVLDQEGALALCVGFFWGVGRAVVFLCRVSKERERERERKKEKKKKTHGACRRRPMPSLSSVNKWSQSHLLRRVVPHRARLGLLRSEDVKLGVHSDALERVVGGCVGGGRGAAAARAELAAAAAADAGGRRCRRRRSVPPSAPDGLLPFPSGSHDEEGAGVLYVVTLALDRMEP